MTMTEEQMHERMKEIDAERDRLWREKNEYEKYFYEIKRKAEAESHKAYVGKCFVSKKLKENKNSHIKAFKIIDVLDIPQETRAICVMLINDEYVNGCEMHSVQIGLLDVWGYNKLSLLSQESDPKMIDFYKEITQEKFEKMYTEWNAKIQKEIYK